MLPSTKDLGEVHRDLRDLEEQEDIFGFVLVGQNRRRRVDLSTWASDRV